MRRKGFLCFGFLIWQNIRELLAFENKNIKIKEWKMKYIKNSEKRITIFFNITSSVRLLCYNTDNKARRKKHERK